MIRARRRLHLALFTLLLPLLPVLLGIALLNRPVVPPTASFASPLATAAQVAPTEHWQPQIVTTEQHQFLLQLLATGNNTVLLIQPQSALLQPDVLLYWMPGVEAVEQLGSHAVLIGHLAGTSRRRLPLPPAANKGTGSLIMFSLAHQRVIEQLPLAAYYRATYETSSQH